MDNEVQVLISGVMSSSGADITGNIFEGKFYKTVKLVICKYYAQYVQKKTNMYLQKQNNDLIFFRISNNKT